jgi:23S rRNA (pseudouridine1915-N3)-methyltransferase
VNLCVLGIFVVQGLLSFAPFASSAVTHASFCYPTFVKLRIAWIQAKPGKDKFPAIQSLTAEYLKRLSRYIPAEPLELPNEASLFKQLDKTSRTAPVLILLDSRGKQLSSEELAQFLDDHKSRGTQQLLFAVGGADGFSAEARSAASTQLSLGKMTLPHELARVILLEQLYRAFTILKGHPYHTGH